MTAQTTARMTECDRCNGNGTIRGYSHVQGGVCFKCGGTGKVATKRQPSAAQIAKKAAAEEARKANAERERRKSKREFDWAERAFGNDPRLANIADGYKRAQAHQLWLAAMGRNWQGKKVKK